ncbi:MAG: hypothetical protein R3B06_03330 [Kofleriaceae bacterium]
MDPEDRYLAYVAELERTYGLRIIKKPDSALHRAIHKALVVVTFGGMRSYLDGYQTTIGRTLYVTADWDDRDPTERYCTLRHEAVHLRQFKTWTVPGMALLYVLLPLPLGLAYFRARFEQEAYAESIRAAVEVHGPDYPRQAWYRDHVIEQFMGASYGWMWPFRRALERWYDDVLAAATAGGTP